MNDFENYIILICSKNISRFTEKKSRRDIDNTRFVEFGEDWNVLVHGLSRRMAEWCSYVSPIEFEESDVLSYQAIIFANSTKRGRTLLVFRFRRVLTRHLSPRSKPLEFEWNPAKVGRKWRFSVAYFHSRRGGKKKKMRVGRGERIRSSARCDEAWQVATGNRYVGETKPSTYLLTYCEGNHEKVTRARSQPCYARKVKFTVDWQRDKEFAQ